MLTARQKRKENIAEYLLYMFQVEDIIRAFNLDLEHIEKNLVDKFEVRDEVRKEMVDWYANLVLMMEKEHLRQSGHFQFLKNLIDEVERFHRKLLETAVDPGYGVVYRSVAALIDEFRQRSDRHAGDVETCLNAIYGYVLLKVQHKTISAGTQEAMQQFGNWLAALSDNFRKFEAGEIEF